MSCSTSDVEVPIVAGPSRPTLSRSHTSLHHLSPEIIIIGAGIAGSALAYSLSQAGRSVLLLERDLSEPDRIVGELLQPGGVAALQQLGLEKVLEGIDAVPVEGYCVVSGTREVGIPYPALDAMGGEADMTARMGRENGGHGEKGYSNGNGNGHLNGNGNGHGNGHLGLDQATESTRWHVESKSGKKEGRSFHHGRLISSLRKACIDSNSPNLTVLEATVRDLIYCDDSNHVIGVKAALKIPSSSPPMTESIVRNIYAPLTIIADGCASKFRSTRGANLPPTKTKSHFVGVIIKDAKLPRQNMGTVCLTPSGPVLLYQIADEGKETRMLVDVKGKLPSVADGSLRDHIMQNYLPHLPPIVQPSVKSALQTQRLRSMPNSFLPPSQQASSPTSLRGAILVGDAYNMRHPLTGGGMTVAFADAVILTRELRPSERLPPGREGLEDWNVVGESVRRWFWERKGVSGVINVLSMALYDLFGGAEEPEFEVLREGCFRYFELGGECIAGPVGLLSALTPKPLLLFYHFFSVAFYSLYILFTYGVLTPGQEKAKPPSLMELPKTIIFAGRVFWTACVVLLPVIWTEFRI